MGKSFILHKDSLSILDELSDEQAGKLFKVIKSYQNNEDCEMDMLTKIAFLPFKNQFERDNTRYENVCERNKQNGQKGGRPIKTIGTEVTQDNPKNPVGYLETQDNPSEPKKPDSKNDSDSKNKNKRKKDFIPPSLIEVKEYFKQNGYNEQTAYKMFNSYSVADWVDSKGNKILSWKQKAINVWFKDENKITNGKTELQPNYMRPASDF